MTVHLISVGVNILDALADRDKLPADLVKRILDEKPGTVLSRRVADAGAASTQLARWLARADASGREELDSLVAVVKPALWDAAISAELDTFARAAHTRTLAVDDIAVLLATDTVDGLSAALWNAVALVGGELSRVGYLASPRETLGDVRGKAVIVRVPRLDARNEADFCAAMGGLGALGRALCPPATKPGEDFRLYLSGGFKAAIPYLIGLAEGLRSVPDIRGSVEAYVLHELTTGPPIRLPLRRISKDPIERELCGFDRDGVTRSKPDGNFLDGYAYEGDPLRGPWELTAFGHGLRELFELRPVGLLDG